MLDTLLGTKQFPTRKGKRSQVNLMEGDEDSGAGLMSTFLAPTGGTPSSGWEVKTLKILSHLSN